MLHKCLKCFTLYYILDKESQARKTSKIWSEQSSEESEDDSPPKKMKLISNEVEEHNLELPQIPIFPAISNSSEFFILYT